MPEPNGVGTPQLDYSAESKTRKRTFNEGESPVVYSMAEVQTNILARLSTMSGYELTLEIDGISRELGLSTTEIESQIAFYKAHGAVQQQQQTIPDFEPTSVKEMVDLSGAQSMARAPKYIEQPDSYRLKYKPSAQEIEKQSQVQQAIMCESCGSPLGIPAIRPIEVTCPQCGAQALYSV